MRTKSKLKNSPADKNYVLIIRKIPIINLIRQGDFSPCLIFFQNIICPLNCRTGRAELYALCYFLANKNRGAGNSVSLLLLAALLHVLFSPFVSFGVSQFMGYLKGGIAMMIFDGTAIYKYKFGNQHFRSTGCYVSKVGLNKAPIPTVAWRRRSRPIT